MGEFRAENHIFIFRALHVRPSFLPLSLECLPSIYVCFMFLEFWLNLFIKIAVDENVFLSLNSQEIVANKIQYPVGNFLSENIYLCKLILSQKRSSEHFRRGSNLFRSYPEISVYVVAVAQNKVQADFAA